MNLKQHKEAGVMQENNDSTKTGGGDIVGAAMVDDNQDWYMTFNKGPLKDMILKIKEAHNIPDGDIYEFRLKVQELLLDQVESNIDVNNVMSKIDSKFLDIMSKWGGFIRFEYKESSQRAKEHPDN